MNLIINNPKKSLNKAYLKQKVNRDDIENFKKNLKTLFAKINPQEYEENFKIHLIQFLLDTYYKNKHEINTKGRTDLVIHLNNSTNSKAVVLFEVKKPDNKREMLTKNNINVKAFHELILYYLKERIENNNIDIKYLIATNIYEWFIFDSSLFEKLFYKNNSLIKDYNEWNRRQKVSLNTDLFYNEIAKPYLEQLEEDIKFTNFNFLDFKTIIEKDEKTNDNKLVALYKLLSPVHLLKQSFANDSNTLDLKFYSELLHILGLEEIKVDGKKIITRKSPENRHSASLIENIINIILSDERLDSISSLETYGETKEKQLFNIALELCITWINRIIFIKLLESQIVKYNRKSDDFKFLDYKHIPDFDELNKLFFQALAVKQNERRKDLQKKYKVVPYLNSSLFEISELENQTIRINSLENNLELPLFNLTVLKDSFGKRETGSKGALKYLLEFLDSYDFTSEGADIIQEGNKTLINASVLGLIFEKINGYKDGSFFTPGSITMFMSREALRLAVIQKFKESKNWDIETFDDLKNYVSTFNKTKDILELNEIINSLKICDPAVGSGHFLVSVLNEIIAIKHDLGILADTHGVRLSDYEISIENDELIITDRNIEIFEYTVNPDGKPSKQVHEIQKLLFHEKEFLIENCLFGVDINPNSVKICRLRLWIELLKNAYYTEESKFTELETLPNIDINIKQGNSLVSKFPLSINGNMPVKSKLELEKYKENVKLYKSVTKRESKNALKSYIEKFKEEQSEYLSEKLDPRNKRLTSLTSDLHKLNTVGMLDLHLSEDEIEMQRQKRNVLINEIEKLKKQIETERSQFLLMKTIEWRFEFPELLDDEGNFTGFDVVIGNPPYGVNLSNGEKKYVQNHYESAKTKNGKQKGSLDTFSLFIELGLTISNKNAFITNIVPLAFTSSESMSALHNLIYNTCEELWVSTYSNRPKKIFDNADQRVSVILCHKNYIPNKFIYTTKVNKRYTETPVEDVIKNLSFVDCKEYIKYGRIPKVGSKIELSILKKIFKIKTNLAELIKEKGKPVFYRAAGGRYYNIITNFSTNSSAEKSFNVNAKIRDVVAAILSTNLFYWFYHIYSDTLNMKMYELEILPIPLDKFSEGKIKEIEKLYNEYLKDLQKHSKIKKVNYSHVSEYREYYARYSKDIIDKIDLAIKDAYGFTDKEIEFIINYDLEFRTDD